MKYLIAGLGNIGEEYMHTRHNIGFDILDTLAENEGVQFKVERLAFYTKFNYKGRQLHLIKPTTYMNRSGRAVKYWLNKLDINISNLLVINDDISLPFNKVRLKAKGSDGGHNGLKDIQYELDTNEYARLRFGIGNEFGKGQQVHYVLGRWTDPEWSEIAPGIDKSIDIIKSFCFSGVERTMNFYN
ncbi:MAG: aminoacyl-tRNA hydrolase [Chitinophagales bacterium]|nr:aminoacyl-tRNA hydrolase [Chitinophagales bacterium]